MSVEQNRVSDLPPFCAPRENSERAQQGHTKCSVGRDGLLWPMWPQVPALQRLLTNLLWLDLVWRDLGIVVHTGEVQGSIPCAPTTSMTYPVNSPNVPQKRGKRSFATSALGVRTISLAHKIVVLMPTEGMTDTTAPWSFLVWRRECCWQWRAFAE